MERVTASDIVWWRGGGGDAYGGAKFPKLVYAPFRRCWPAHNSFENSDFFFFFLKARRAEGGAKRRGGGGGSTTNYL